MNHVVQHDLARPRDADEARREIDRRPDHRIGAVLVAAHAACDDFAGCDADVHVERLSRRRADVGHRTNDRVGRADCACRIVAMRDGRAEDRHHRVADVLVDATAEALDDRVDRAEESLEHPMDVLGVLRLRQPCEAAQVGEQHGDGSALGLRGFGSRVHRGRRRDRERPAAAAAELFSGLVRESAVRAAERQRGAALRAEPPPGTVVRAAPCANLPTRVVHRYPLTLQRAPSESTNSASVTPCSGSGARVKRTPAAVSA